MRWMSYGINYQPYYRWANGVQESYIDDAPGTIIVSDSCSRPFTCFRVGGSCPHAPYNPDAEVPLSPDSSNTYGFWTRHNGGANHLFFDGHVKWMRRILQRNLTRILD